MSYYLRRRFCRSVLPDKPPEKYEHPRARTANIKPFNEWFCATVERLGCGYLALSDASGIPYSSLMSYKRQCSPKNWNQHLLSLGLEALGAGEYSLLRDKIRQVCNDKRRV